MQREKSGGPRIERQSARGRKRSLQRTAKVWPERAHHDTEVKMAEFKKEGVPGRPNETKPGKGRLKNVHRLYSLTQALQWLFSKGSVITVFPGT